MDSAPELPEEDVQMEEGAEKPRKVTKSRTKNAKYCCVTGCKRNTVVHAQEVKFFAIPGASKSDQRELFLRAINKATKDGSPWNPKTNTALICSRHFVSGKPSPTKTSPDYYPTRNLGNDTAVKPKTGADMARFNRAMNRRSTAMTPRSASTATPTSSSATTSTFSPSAEETPASSSEFMEMCAAFNSIHVQTDSLYKADVGVGTFHNELRPANTQTEEKKTDVPRSFNVQMFDDAQMKSLTGVSRPIFAFLLSKLNEALSTTNYATEPMLELFLVKCKLNLTYTVVAGMFGIRKETASIWFKKVTHILHNKLLPYIMWFPRPYIQARMPPRFKTLGYGNTRVIIDGTEIKTERPSKQKMRIHLWSNYKHAYTMKLLVGIAPSGEITFLSKAYGGRATDTEITVRSGVLQLLEKGDRVSN